MMLLRNIPASNLIYKFTLFLSFVVLLGSSWNAPISGDEYVHVVQAKKNISYLQTLGDNKEALNTPISRLKHYGQSFDTITTWLAGLLEIENLYRFRHICNALMAWLIILYTSLLSQLIIKNKWVAFLTVILFLVSGRFMGHAMNNLKDIPFAFAFVFSTYYTFKFILKLPNISWNNLALLTLGIAFGISIRIGGLLIYAYYLLFTGLYFYYLIVNEKIKKHQLTRFILKLGAVSCLVLFMSYAIGILLWPYALENPFVNPLKSLDLMHHYPTTVRQIFEGKLYWSDRFPWYYLFKYLLITSPIVIVLGFLAYFIFVVRMKGKQGIILSIFTVMAFGFPLFYATATGANVYGGWRQLLFCYPFLVVLSSVGIWTFYEWVSKWEKIRRIAILVFVVMLLHPIQFAIQNYPYQYIYFNQLVGGVRQTYGNYELDYYFTSYKKAYDFIDNHISDNPEIVAANFVIPEYYHEKPYRPKLLNYYDRANSDWDYAIICNTFLDPYQLQKNIWPPDNVVYIEEVDGKPILVILKRESKVDLEGKHLLNSGKFESAIEKLNLALELDKKNESILINLTRAYIGLNQFENALKTILEIQSIYPDNEWAMDLKGNILEKTGKPEEAMETYQQIISNNYKFYHAYISLAKIYISTKNTDMAITTLKDCLHINPFYEPAYKIYGNILIDKGEKELGNKMLEFSIKGNSKYGRN